MKLNATNEMNECRERVRTIFSNFERNFVDRSLTEQNNSVAFITAGLIAFEAVRNTYPEADSEEVAMDVATHIATSIHLAELLDQGRIERRISDSGEIIYLPKRS